MCNHQKRLLWDISSCFWRLPLWVFQCCQMLHIHLWGRRKAKLMSECVPSPGCLTAVFLSAITTGVRVRWNSPSSAGRRRVLIEVTVYREDMAVMSGMLDFTHSTLQFDISNLAPGHYDIYAYSNGRNLHVGEIDVDWQTDIFLLIYS